MSLLPTVLAGAVTATAAGPTAVSLQLSAGLEAPERVVEAIATGLEAGGEEVRLAPAAPPDCASSATCLTRLLAGADASAALLLVLVGLDDDVQVAATRARPGRAPEDLEPTLLPKVSLTEAALALGRRWARPPAPVLVVTREARLPDRTGPPLATWVTGGVGVAALGAGIGLAVAAGNTDAGLERDGCAARACDPARVDRLEREVLAADALFATAAISAAAALVVWWLDGGGEEPAP